MCAVSYLTGGDAGDVQNRVKRWDIALQQGLQSSGYAAAFEKQANTITKDILRDLRALIVLKEEEEEPQSAELLQLVRKILRTAVQMKCQRGSYGLESVQVGMPFNSTAMEDVTVKEYNVEEKKKLVAKAVLSDGIIKRPYSRAEEVIGRVCKARVIAGLSEK